VVVIWGGLDINNIRLNTGGSYNPGTNTWMATSTTNAPAARAGHTAVWADSEMIIWGGTGESSGLTIGGRYNPTKDSWVPTGGAPAARVSHTAVWTGSEMIVWGGRDENSPFPLPLNTGGTYIPTTDNWAAMSTANAPTPRLSHTAVWSGSEMIVWGGTDLQGTDFNSGGDTLLPRILG
jgi:N-acetylneuraminic acid mutarotase